MFLFDLFLHSFLLLLLPVVDLALAESTDCYYPNGKLSRDTAACYSEFLGPTGLCCKPGDLCLNNTLCAMKFTGNHMSYYRGTCLDATWSNPSCPDFCLGSSRKPQALVPVFPCEDDETGKQWYCGDHGPPDKKGSCELFHGSFALSQNTNPYAVAGAVPKNPPPASSAKESSTAAKDPSQTKGTSSSVAHEPEHTRPLSEANHIETTVLTTTVTTLGQDVSMPHFPTALPTTPPSTQQEDAQGGPAALPIGLGIGVGVSVLAALAIVGFFHLRKRRRQATVRAETPPPFEFAFVDSRPPPRGQLGPFHRDKLGGGRGNRWHPPTAF